MKNKIIIILVLLISIFLIIHYKNRKDNEKSKNNNFKPYENSLNIISSKNDNLNGMGFQEIASFKIMKVKEYEILKFFPEDYNPFKFPHNNIYGKITPFKDWLAPVPYYIANPYLLIILTCAGHVTPLNYYCPDVQIKYSYGKIT